MNEGYVFSDKAVLKKSAPGLLESGDASSMYLCCYEKDSVIPRCYIYTDEYTSGLRDRIPEIIERNLNGQRPLPECPLIKTVLHTGTEVNGIEKR